MKDKFLYLEQFMTALEDLDKEDIYRATYVLCYYGLYREFPEDATAVDKMYVKANAKLFDGQDAYAVKQAERGKKGGRQSEKLTVRTILDFDEPYRSLKLSFQSAVKNPTVTYAMPYGFIEKTANGEEEPCHTWCDLCEADGKGLALLNTSK